MKPILLAALAVPLLFTGCGTYVGVDGGDYGPGYYAYGGPGYYDGVYGDVAVYGYDRGGYNAHYHHYDGGYHNAALARSGSHVGGGSRVAGVSHSGGGHEGGGGASHASASAGGMGGGGGHR